MQPVLTLGASSVGAADMVRLRHTVGQAAARLPFALEWRPDALAETADVLFVDVDTVYGHVDWLRAQVGGRVLIALTSRSIGAHDNELARDADASVLEAMLRGFATLAHAPTGAPQDVQTSPAALKATSEMPVAQTPVADSRFAATREMPTLTAAPAAAPVAEPVAEAPPPPPRESMSLHDWLRHDDGLAAPAALKAPDGGLLLVDRAQSNYFGPASLKPLLPLSQGMIARGDWQSLDAASLVERTRGSEPMPLARLRLLAGLGAFNGALATDLDPALPFRLPKWPQIEREFPRHMRIATALMKGPATIDELVSQLGMPYAEVADFLNGFVAAGFVDQVMPVAEPEAPPPAAGERLMGRLRAFGRKP